MKKIIINGRQYGLQPLMADDQFDLGMDLLPLVASPISDVLGNPNISIASILQAAADKSKEAESDDSTLMSLVPILLSSVSKIDMPKFKDLLRRAILSVTTDSGNLSNGDIRMAHFQQCPGDYMPVAIWALWGNTKDFLSGAIPGMKEVFLGSAGLNSASTSPMSGNVNTPSAESLKPDIAPIPTLKRG